LIVGVSGASGTILAVRLLQLLQDTEVETHLVVSRAGDMTRAHELPHTGAELRELADVAYPIGDVGAAVASGSFRTLGMVVIPCSAKTLAEVATGVTANLLTRAADVVLKERRRLVLCLRETPLNLIHLRNMTTATEAGAIIMPPVPAFYARPTSVDDLVTQFACRVLDLFEIDAPPIRRWGEDLGMRLPSADTPSVDSRPHTPKNE
jgi:4-hydroxy-3-polyprenylbenzoate decarboxylase